jgi:hypothetical protein
MAVLLWHIMWLGFRVTLTLNPNHTDTDHCCCCYCYLATAREVLNVLSTECYNKQSICVHCSMSRFTSQTMHKETKQAAKGHVLQAMDFGKICHVTILSPQTMCQAQ